MKINLTTRLTLSLLISGLIPLAALTTLGLNSAHKIANLYRSQILGLSNFAMELVERNLLKRYRDAQAFSINSDARDALVSGDTTLLTTAINDYVKLYEVYNLCMVVDLNGNVVAVNDVNNKGEHIDTSFLIGKNFSQADWFTHAKNGIFTKSKDVTGTVMSDPIRDVDNAKVTGSDELIMNFSAPIKSKDGAVLGVWRNLANFALIEEIMKMPYAELKKQGVLSAEVSMVDAKGTVLAHFDPQGEGKEEMIHDPSIILNRNLVKEGDEIAKMAMGGHSGVGRDFDPVHKVWVTACYADSKGAMGLPDLNWVIMVSVHEQELMNNVITITEAASVIAILFMLLAAFFIARSISRPIVACSSVVEKLANGDLTGKVGISRSDELGILSSSIDSCVNNLRKMIDEIVRTSQSLAESSSVLTRTANSQAASAEQTNVQANTVAAAGEELATNSKVMTNSAGHISESASAVSVSLEEMSASIQEVARSCAKESEIATKADQQARQTRALMEKLEESASQIGKIVELINRIAEQTNLLALNATIEAASAGEAGRGFAVVANEVKELARQSAAATEDIRSQVALIQDNATNSMTAIDDVAKVIEQVSEIASSIAAAVEEQSATTSEIVRSINNLTNSTKVLSDNIKSASSGADEVSRNIHGVSDASSESAKGASLISSSAAELSRLAGALSQLVTKFKL